MEIAIVFISLLVILTALLKYFQTVTIFEWERGLKYQKGKFIKELEPGKYRLFWHDKIDKFDIRKNFEVVPGQEILTADGASIKLSLIISFEIADLNLAINKVKNYTSAIYLVAQSAIREIISGIKLDDFLEKREVFNDELQKKIKDEIAKIGLNIIDIAIRDVVLTGELKKSMAQVLSAQKESLAKLERARGETAALRNLANAAHMIDDNPNLLQLRFLETLSQSSGNTIVFNADNNPLIIKKSKT